MSGNKNQEKNKNEDSSPVKSYELVTDELVRGALQNDKGKDAELLSWQIIPFTSKGDNYSSVVISVAVKYRISGIQKEVSYVTKLNPLRPITSFSDFMEKGFTREAQVLGEIVRGMNRQLEKLGLDPLRTPKLFFDILETRKEAFVTENLTKQGFKMHDRMKGIDFNPALFVVKELGRFHASSLLLEESLPTKSIPETYNALKGPWMYFNEEGFETFSKMFSSYGQSAGNYLKRLDPKYEKCSNWLLKHAYKLGSEYLKGIAPSNNHFDVLIHGDCWTNNMLFKYNEDGIPVDFRFVDLQCSGKASATSDLNYFFYTSLTGDFRRRNYNSLITAYYQSFSEVLRRARMEPPFSYLELKKELYHRKIFGLASGMLVLQIMLSQGDEIPDVDNLTDGNMEEFTELQNKTFYKMANRGGAFKDRYVTMFEDMLDTNIFDEL